MHQVFHKGELIIPQTELLRRIHKNYYWVTKYGMRGGSPVVINNVNNSQSNPTISNQGNNYEST